MRRKTFDALAVIGGLILAVVLLVAGGLLLWGHGFVNDQVHTQLAAQKIYFPPASSGAIKALPATDARAMTAYAGQQMTTGDQAKAFAVELQRGVEIADANHRMQVPHRPVRSSPSRNRSGSSDCVGSTAYRVKSVIPEANSTSSSIRK